MTGTAGDRGGGAAADLYRLSLMSLLAALCPLVPVPWLDDWAERLVRRRAVADLLRERGVDPTPADVAVLAGLEPARPRGCVELLLWPLTGVVFYAAKKLFRKVFFVLALGDAVRAGSTLFHDAYLLRHALVARGELPPGPDGRLDRERARAVRRAIEATTAGSDPAPVVGALRRALAGSGRLLAAEAVRLGTWLSRQRRATAAAPGGGGAGEERAAEELPVDREEAALGGLAGRLAAALGVETAYRAALERRLEALLDAPPPVAPAPAAPPPGGPADLG
jgi:hypothetical protein